MTGEMDAQHDPRITGEVAEALEAIRSALTAPPPEHVAQRHLAAMRDAASEAPAGWWAGLRQRNVGRNPMPALTPRWLVVGAVALLGFTGGLAAAGNLPDAAQSFVSQTVSHVGLDLPDPADDNAKAKGHDEGDADADGDSDDVTGSDEDNHGQTVSSVARDDSLEGCEHGQAVRDVASSKSQGNEDAPGRSEDHDPCANAGADGEDEGEPEGESEVSEDSTPGPPEEHPGGGHGLGADGDDDTAPGNSENAPLGNPTS